MREKKEPGTKALEIYPRARSQRYDVGEISCNIGRKLFPGLGRSLKGFEREDTCLSP